MATVPIVAVAVAVCVPSRVTEAGLMTQVIFAGNVPQERATENAAPFTGAMEIVDVPEAPAARLRLAGVVVMLKSVVGLAFTVSVDADEVLAANFVSPP